MKKFHCKFGFIYIGIILLALTCCCFISACSPPQRDKTKSISVSVGWSPMDLALRKILKMPLKVLFFSLKSMFCWLLPVENPKYSSPIWLRPSWRKTFSFLRNVSNSFPETNSRTALKLCSTRCRSNPGKKEVLKKAWNLSINKEQGQKLPISWVWATFLQSKVK